MAIKSAKAAASGSTLNVKQQAALQSAEDAFTAIVRRGYAAGLDAGWLQLALWHATDRVEGVSQATNQTGPSVPQKAALTRPLGSAKVGRGRRKKKVD